MGTPKKKRKVKRKLKIKTGAAIVRKDSIRNDTMPRMQARPPADVAPTFKIKIRKK